jgi:hypothetical protein
LAARIIKKGVEVADHEARHPDRVGGVVALGERHAAVERHCHGEGLEHRPQLVDAQGDPVEAGLVIGGVDAAGLEVGQGDQRQDLAARGVEHQATAAGGAVIGDGARQLLAQGMLDPDVEGQLEGAAPRRPGVAEAVVEVLLDAGEATIVDACEADHVGGQPTLGVDPAALALEAEPGQPQPVDGVLLPGREIALDPDESGLGLELPEHPWIAQLRDQAGQLARRLVRVEHPPGIGVERSGGEIAGEQDAVAVDHVGAAAGEHRMPSGPPQGGLATLDQGHLHQPTDKGEKQHREHRPSDQQSGAAGLDGGRRVAAATRRLSAALGRRRHRRQPAFEGELLGRSHCAAPVLASIAPPVGEAGLGTGRGGVEGDGRGAAAAGSWSPRRR